MGLNEIRLSLKTDRHDTFTKYPTDDIIKLRQHTSRESLSPSEISKHSGGGVANNMKYIRTTSPYSSTNSLNSIDSSTGMSSISRTNHHPPVAPTRKKRMAPRPPSQNSIPENQSTTTAHSKTIIENNNNNNNGNNDNETAFKVPLPIIPRKKFHFSSPNLANHHQQQNDQTKAITDTSSTYKEFNNNNIAHLNTETEQKKGDVVTIRPAAQMFTKSNGANTNGKSKDSILYHSSTSSETEEMAESKEIPPEPIPRKRPLGKSCFMNFFLTLDPNMCDAEVLAASEHSHYSQYNIPLLYATTESLTPYGKMSNTVTPIPAFNTRSNTNTPVAVIFS